MVVLVCDDLAVGLDFPLPGLRDAASLGMVANRIPSIGKVGDGLGFGGGPQGDGLQMQGMRDAV